MKLGAWNDLRIDRFASHGAYLEDEEGNDVLLPQKYVDPDLQEDDMVNVFIYKDSEDRIIATTLRPKVEVNQFAVLQVMELNQFGAFLDWGVEKHLFVPYREQPKKLEEGKYYLIYVYVDDATHRLVGTTRLHRHIQPVEEGDLQVNEKVELVICERTELGVKVIVNHKYNGLIFNSEIRQTIKMGYRLAGYVKQIRPDGKLDIVLQPEGYDKVEGLSRKMLQLLTENDGFIHLTDKSSPEEIEDVTGWSKKVFKQVIGNLYKQRLILIHENGIALVED